MICNKNNKAYSVRPLVKDIVIQPDWHTIMVSNINHLKIVWDKSKKAIGRQWCKEQINFSEDNTWPGLPRICSAISSTATALYQWIPNFKRRI